MKLWTVRACLCAVIAASPVAGGCAAAEEPSESTADSLSESTATGGADAPSDPALMREILAAAAEDVVALGLSDDADVQPASQALRPATFAGSVAPTGYGSDLVDVAKMTFGGRSACSVLRPLKPLEHGFFFGGIIVNGGAGVIINQGVEGAVDVYNQQGAVFNFQGAGLSPQLGFSLGTYTGLGADLQARTATNLKDLWGGVFWSASASIGVGKFISANASGFVSADGTIAGGSVGLAGGWGTPLAVFSNVSVQGSNYVFNRDATRSWFGGTGDGSAYFSSARQVTAAALRVSPGISLYGFGRRTLTNFLIEAILKAKYKRQNLSALCPG